MDAPPLPLARGGAESIPFVCSFTASYLLG
jgi:hypothetical protein